MDFHHNSPSESGKFEKIISKCLLKTLHVILASRIPSLKPQDCDVSLSSSSSRARKSDEWFSLALGDRPAALENLHFWHRKLMDPMVIDIIGVHQGEGAESTDDLYGAGFTRGIPVETVIERWIVQYESSKAHSAVQTGDFSSLYRKMYKKLIILLRSVHTMMRLLPAYRIFKHLSSASQSCNYDVIYKVSSFSDPFSRKEEKMMKQHNFVPVEAVSGRLCISVTYRTMLSEFNFESSTSFPPMIIADYVGSPATDPLRFFPSMPTDKSVNATSFSVRGTRLPPSLPSQRPHSWSSGIHSGAYVQNQLVCRSPPAYQGSYVPNYLTSSPKSIQGQRSHYPRFSSSHQKSSSYDEHQLSPPFSPSSSPSNPTYLSHSPSKSRSRAESAPVAIPHPMLNQHSKYLSPNLSDPSRHPLPPLSPRSTRLDRSLSESPSPSRIRSSRRSEGTRPRELNSGISHQAFSPKVCKDSREDSGRFSGLLSSGSSPRVGFSRSSSRLSFGDDLDECDFSCPFDVDDVDTSDSQSSHSMDTKKCLEFTNPSFSMGRKSSQAAAVGALIQMLKSAPPLRQDSSVYSSSQSLNIPNQAAGNNFASASGFLMTRKASDALEELRSFRDMKDLLISKSGASQVISRESI